MAVTLAQVTALVDIPADTLTDEQVTAAIAGQTTPLRAAAGVCRRVASYYASRVDVSAGGASVKSGQAYWNWLRLAREFEARYQTSASGPVVNGASSSRFDHEQFVNDGRGLQQGER